ncbi:cellulose biosynthesis protein BcsP [Silanimonas sp.]|jgi:hypothetical protein|uniref:cellulose biosynthesis protein BcsP n=1 Tax=Silanimonas sp. TaxID=1929290 RepID=UPI0037CBCEAF
MVKKAGGDIEGLFRSFGSDSGSYRELAREADARDAQQRWPMLGEIAPEAGVRPDALDAASKRHWREHGEGDAESPLPPPQASAEGRRLMGGLDHLLQRGSAPQTDPADAPAPRAWGAAKPQPQPPVPAEAPRSSAGASRSVRKEEPQRLDLRGKAGLFGGIDRGEKAGEEAPRSALSGLFSRLEGEARGTKPLVPGRLRKR